jgi:hypothetical protein
MVTLDELKDAGIHPGSKLEITLARGAKYSGGYSPHSMIDKYMEGFDPSGEMKREPGAKIVGYVEGLKSTELSEDMGVYVCCGERVVMHNMSDPTAQFSRMMAPWYVDVKCIHSFKKV